MVAVAPVVKRLSSRPGVPRVISILRRFRVQANYLQATPPPVVVTRPQAGSLSV
ncbi:Protein of unknown function [Pyronema omphalodes CBS 100304]|uniref:Uncharacterized protein n=1 Tax=Pyronema omphalodes (strain CBS 100304) TaxID=1076935 RepID=U4LKP6_PYROM|nr:Protein of unknown function [Pyronema omphalodes CBS 100304]